MSIGRTVVRLLRAAHGYLRGVVGEDRYEYYLRHHRQYHQESPPLSRRDYWRAVYAEQDRNPSARCC